MNIKQSIFLSLLLLLSVSVWADSPKGALDEALIASARKAPRNASLNRAAAEALRESGRLAEAIPFYLRSGNTGNLCAAEASFYLYRFDDAREYLDKYLDKRTKAEAEKESTVTLANGETTERLSDYLAGRIDLGRSMLDRVEKIQVIDSVNVPVERVLQFIRLARDAGSIISEEVTSRLVSDQVLDSLGMAYLDASAYLTERGDELYWVASTEDGNSSLFESTRLSDGEWDSPHRLFDYESLFGNNSGLSVSSPFLMPDGVTLYFAADGDESLGGLDIFISRRDDNGNFLQPSNIGMPYNSPANDYLYAIDETNGVGWWVSDRSGLTDSVTVYMFIPQELRINYDIDTPRLADYAMLSSISLTQPAGADYRALRRRVDNLSSGLSGIQSSGSGSADFDFALPDGRVVHRLSDFRSSLARNAMIRLLKAQTSFNTEVENLEKLRRRYANGDHTVAHEILRRERQLEHLRAELRELSNQVASNEQ